MPKEGRHQDTVLEVTVESHELVKIMYNEQVTEPWAKMTPDRFDQLSNQAVRSGTLRVTVCGDCTPYGHLRV